MSIDIFKGKDVMSGSHGKCMIDGQTFAEVFEWEATVKLERKEINLPGGQKGSKIVATSGEGTLKRYKINSNWVKKFSKLTNTKEVYFDLYLEVNDPDAVGAEAITIKSCWNSEGFSFSSKHGEEITEELKFGFISNKLEIVEEA